MISPNLTGDFAVYTSGFQPEADQIMDPSIFLNAADIAVDNNRNSYIVDQQSSDITVFNFNGSNFANSLTPASSAALLTRSSDAS